VRNEPQPQNNDRTLYLGNLPYDTNMEEVEQLVREAADAVQRVHLPAGPDGRLRGFGFVTMQTSEAAAEAVEALRDREFRGRRLTINIAHPRSERSDRPERPHASRHPTEGPPPRSFESLPSVPFDPATQSARPVEGRRARQPERVADGKKKKNKGVRRTERFEDRRGKKTGREWKDWDED
jgi:RNA recognition motif-containing protein